MAEKNKYNVELITQTEAAKVRGVSVAAINELVRRGRIRSKTVLGRRVVYRADVLAFEPKTHKNRAAKKQSTKKKATKR